MASNASTPRFGHVARVIHWLIPSRRQVAISLASDVGLVALGLPLWAHLILALVIHLAVAVLD